MTMLPSLCVFFWLEFGDAFIFLCFFLSVFNLMYCLFMFVSVF